MQTFDQTAFVVPYRLRLSSFSPQYRGERQQNHNTKRFDSAGRVFNPEVEKAGEQSIHR